MRTCRTHKNPIPISIPVLPLHTFTYLYSVFYIPYSQWDPYSISLASPPIGSTALPAPVVFSFYFGAFIYFYIQTLRDALTHRPTN